MLRIQFTFWLSILLTGCVTPNLPDHVVGQFPETKPPMEVFYKGVPLDKKQSSLLVTGHLDEQTHLYITSVDGMRSMKKGLIGGARVANVLPGTHSIQLQFHDKHRLIIPLKLDNVAVSANTGYLINFSAHYPKHYLENPIEKNSELAIDITVTNLDNNQIVKDVTFNGWGKLVRSKK